MVIDYRNANSIVWRFMRNMGWQFNKYDSTWLKRPLPRSGVVEIDLNAVKLNDIKIEKVNRATRVNLDAWVMFHLIAQPNNIPVTWRGRVIYFTGSTWIHKYRDRIVKSGEAIWVDAYTEFTRWIVITEDGSIMHPCGYGRERDKVIKKLMRKNPNKA